MASRSYSRALAAIVDDQQRRGNNERGGTSVNHEARVNGRVGRADGRVGRVKDSGELKGSGFYDSESPKVSAVEPKAEDIQRSAAYLLQLGPSLFEGMCSCCKEILSERLSSLGSGNTSLSTCAPSGVKLISRVKESEAPSATGHHEAAPRNNSMVPSGAKHRLWSEEESPASSEIDEELPFREGNESSESEPRDGDDAVLGSPLPLACTLAEKAETANPKLSREELEKRSLERVERELTYVYDERLRGKMVNIIEGLELHKNVFNGLEQQRLVNFVNDIEKKGRAGELRERTFTAPRKWMGGKGRITLQFGCCYNYASDRKGNPPGIIHDEQVDPLPDVLKKSIRRLVKWKVLPETCVPDSCIINIYAPGDCIPPHIDHHDFVRPFCTLSLLSECPIVFGSTLSVTGEGQFSGPISINLPTGSVLVLQGNAADVAKHAISAVEQKRISITFRKMDPSKVPCGYKLPNDLKNIKALPTQSSASSSG